jgi:gluconate 2-dehydrogenase alpha chain
MGVDPTTSVVDPTGRMHFMDNVFVTDSSVFVTSGGSNPTQTIMAVALRIARGLTGQSSPATAAQARTG